MKFGESQRFSLRTATYDTYNHLTCAQKLIENCQFGLAYGTKLTLQVQMY